MDAVGCPDSEQADPITGAAHACGHNIQMVSMMGAAYGLIKSAVIEELSGNVVFLLFQLKSFLRLNIDQS